MEPARESIRHALGGIERSQTGAWLGFARALIRNRKCLFEDRSVLMKSAIAALESASLLEACRRADGQPADPSLTAGAHI